MNFEALLKRLVYFLGSYGLACVLLALLALLTFLGTIEQVDLGLHAVQEKYFESPFLIHLFELGQVDGKPVGIPVPLPGAYLVMWLLLINLVVGGLILRGLMRFRFSRLGVLIVHLGIVMLLAAGFVKMLDSVEGHMTLFEGESSDEFVSYHDWEVAISKAPARGRAAASVHELIIPQEDFAGPSKTRFTSSQLPFDLTLDGFLPNSRPRQKQARDEVSTSVVDGVYLEGVEPAREAELNIAGLRASVREKASGAEQPGLLWGRRDVPPWAVKIGADWWLIELRKRRTQMPFEIKLDKFEVKFHPGTRMASSYMSEVTKTEDGVEQRVKIRMNEPLRREGFTLYQSGWGPQDAPPGAKHFSVLAVVRNPSDQWPLFACLVITFGLLWHFGYRLALYLVAESRRRTS